MKMIRYNSVTGERIEYEDLSQAPVRNIFCPCCGYKTLAERGGYDICPVCFWEDDGQDDCDADAVRGGPNSTLSLREARQNFTAFGACEMSMLPNVRLPYEDELRK